MGVTKYRPKITRVPMTDQEKNEVLALAYGFARPGGVTLGDWGPVVPDTPATAIFWRHKTTGEELTSQQIEVGTRWLYPDGTYQNAPPDFLHSLDAQAKWLLPKLLPDYEVQIRWDTFGDVDFKQGWNAVIFGMNREHREDIVSHGETPAEACAEAMLSLIGEDDGTQMQ